MSPPLHGAAYRLAYLIGRTPWDTGISPPELVEAVEGPDRLAPGRALDIGCGTGTNCIYLARHGWTAVGIDMTARAVRRARAKVASAGVGVAIHRGDATRLESLALGPAFDLLLDIGCFHSVPAGRRSAYAEGAAAVARPGATFLLFCFRGRSGALDGELRRALEPAFEVVDVRRGSGGHDPAWYRMRRRQRP